MPANLSAWQDANKLCWHARPSIVRTCGTPEEHSCRMLKMTRLLTRPTLAATSPARPESAKTVSSPRDAPFHGQGRSKQPKMVLPSLLVYVELWWLERVPRCALGMALSFSPPLFRGVAEAALYCAHRTSTVSSCAFCEQEGHLAAPSPAGGLFQYPAMIFSCLLRKEETENSSVAQQWPGPSTSRQALIPAISWHP